MRQIHDLDVIILMATTLASKRRPAQLVEIVAAADLLQGTIPFVEKLGDAIRRLSVFGLISATENGFMLTPIAQELMARQGKKAATEELIITIKSDLAAYDPKGDIPPILSSEDELCAAILAHKASRKVRGQNLLMPKTQARPSLQGGGPLLAARGEFLRKGESPRLQQRHSIRLKCCCPNRT